jgi:type VI secretion system secreted protein VgrG
VTNKTIHRGDATAANAEGAVTTAYNDAAGRKPVNSVAVELGGRTLKPGIYGNPTLGITGTLTLDGQHNANAVFVFQTSKTLITAVGSKVALINGANPCNVFWKVGSSATIDVGSKFVGTVLALTSISAKTGATIQGRLFARNGAVTLDTNTITAGVCSISSPVTTTTAPRPPTTSPATTTPSSPAASTTVPAPAAASTTTVAPGVLNGTTGSPTTLSGSTVGGGGATVGSPKPLAATGANVTLTALAGLLALVLGAALLLGSRRLRASGPK